MAAASLNDEASLFDATDPTAPLSETRLREGDQCLLLLTVDRVAGLVKNATVVVVETRWHAVVIEMQDSSGAPTRHERARLALARQDGTDSLRFWAVSSSPEHALQREHATYSESW